MQTDSLHPLRAIQPKSDHLVAAKAGDSPRQQAHAFSLIFAEISQPKKDSMPAEDQAAASGVDDVEMPDADADESPKLAEQDHSDLPASASSSETPRQIDERPSTTQSAGDGKGVLAHDKKDPTPQTPPVLAPEADGRLSYGTASELTGIGGTPPNPDFKQQDDGTPAPPRRTRHAAPLSAAEARFESGKLDAKPVAGAPIPQGTHVDKAAANVAATSSSAHEGARLVHSITPPESPAAEPARTNAARASETPPGMTWAPVSENVMARAQPFGLAIEAKALSGSRASKDELAMAMAAGPGTSKLSRAEAPPVLPSATMPATHGSLEEKLNLAGDGILDTDGLPSGKETPSHVAPRADTAGAQPLSPAFDPSSVRPDSIRNAAANAVEVLLRQPGKPVEISLDPKELGRVRIALSTSETGVTVIITAERAETQELMRRHIDQLAAEFHRLGYDETSFEFNGESGGQENGFGPQGPDAMAERTETDTPVTERTYRLVSTGLDLRL